MECNPDSTNSMKKKSASKSAFFNLRVLIGLCIALAGISVALLGLDAFAANTAPVKITNHIITTSNDPLVPVGFDCTKIRQLGIDKQENFRAGAIMIACGAAEGGSGSSVGFFQRITQAVKTITRAAVWRRGRQSESPARRPLPTSPSRRHSARLTRITLNRFSSPTTTREAVTQSDQYLRRVDLHRWRHDVHPRHHASGQSPFAGTEGDPVVLYNKPTSTWFTVWLDTGCGGQGLGGYKSTTPANPASWTHFCVHIAAGDDRESGWADNNPASPFFGRMYISWGNGGGVSPPPTPVITDYVARSDTGCPCQPLHPRRADHRRLSGNGVLYIAGMNEWVAASPTTTSTISSSQPTGVTRGPTLHRSHFSWTGRYRCGLLRLHVYASRGYWRHEGWGEPAAFNHVVHLVYASTALVVIPATSITSALPTAV